MTKISDSAAALVAVVTLVAAATFMRHERKPKANRMQSTAVENIADGRRFARHGILVGDSTAPVRIVFFSDFECHYCRQMNATLDSQMTRHPHVAAVVYRHFPRSALGHAIPAAVAAECAGSQGAFASYAALLFAHQDSIGQVNLEHIAASSGVQDLAAFRACLASSIPRARLAEDIAAGRELGITATPSYLIGDRLVAGALPLAQLERFVRAATPETAGDIRP